jgi:hypothetical protein
MVEKAIITIIHGIAIVYKMDGNISEKEANCRMFMSNTDQKAHEYKNEVPIAYAHAIAHKVILYSIVIFFS